MRRLPRGLLFPDVELLQPEPQGFCLTAGAGVGLWVEWGGRGLEVLEEPEGP